MKKNYPVFMLLIGLLALANMSCKKSSSPAKSKTELILQAAWKMEDIGGDINKDGVIDITQMNDCNADDLITFHADGTGVNDEGTILCGTTQSSTFNWLFKNNETVINIDIPQLDDVTIISLTDTEFKGYKEVANPLGGTAWVVVILKH